MKEQTKVIKVPWHRRTIRAYREIWIDRINGASVGVYQIVDLLYLSPLYLLRDALVVSLGCFWLTGMVIQKESWEKCVEDRKQARNCSHLCVCLFLLQNSDNPQKTMADNFASASGISHSFPFG